MPKKCHDCQKNIPARPFTTHVEALYCNACNKAHDAEFKRHEINLERALELFPELRDQAVPSSRIAGTNKWKLIGERPDLQMMESGNTYVVFSDCDKDGMPRVLVFDTESETIAKEKVKSDPAVKNYFDCEIIAMNACISELKSKGQ